MLRKLSIACFVTTPLFETKGGLGRAPSKKGKRRIWNMIIELSAALEKKATS